MACPFTYSACQVSQVSTPEQGHAMFPVTLCQVTPEPKGHVPAICAWKSAVVPVAWPSTYSACQVSHVSTCLLHDHWTLPVTDCQELLAAETGPAAKATRATADKTPASRPKIRNLITSSGMLPESPLPWHRPNGGACSLRAADRAVWPRPWWARPHCPVDSIRPSRSERVRQPHREAPAAPCV